MTENQTLDTYPIIRYDQTMAAAAELPRPIEPVHNPESVRFMSGQEAFQARILAVTAGGNRELLNPNQPVPLLTPDALGSLEPSDFTVVKEASLAERDHYWTTQRSEVAEDARYDTWLEDTKAAFDSGQRFFGTRKGEQWVALFDKLNIQAVGFSDNGNADAENLYNKYFSDENETENVDHFVRDVISAHMDTQGNFDRVAFEQNRDAVQWLANLFGEKSAQVMTQIADGQTRPTQEIATAANQRRNPDQLTDKEAELLNFLYRPEEALRAVTPTRPAQRRTQNQPPPANPPAPIRIHPADVQPTTPRPTIRQPIRTITRPTTPIRVAPTTPPPDVHTHIPTPAGPPEPIDQQPAAPTPEPVRIVTETAPSTDVSENLRAADQFVRVLRDPTRFRLAPPSPFYTGSRFVDNWGFNIGPSLENGFISVLDTANVAEDRYKLPLALYAPDQNAKLILKYPQQKGDGIWHIQTYDPREGIEEDIELENYDPFDLSAQGIYAGHNARIQFEEGTYDIAPNSMPALRAYQEAFMEKLAKAQASPDAKNNAAYAFFTAALLHSLQSGETPFKTEGRRLFEQDFGIHIRTVEDILATRRAPTPPPTSTA